MFSFLTGKQAKKSRTLSNSILGGAKMALFKHASDGNLEEVNRLTSLPDVNINFMFNNITPLQIAMLHGNTDVVRLLIERGANVNLSHPTLDTPLVMSIKYMHYDLTRLLLEYGADKYDTSFYVALKTQDVTAFYELLHTGEIDIPYLEHVYSAAEDVDAQMLLYLMQKMVPEVSDKSLTFPLQVHHDGRILSLTEEDAEKIYRQLGSGPGSNNGSSTASIPNSNNRSEPGSNNTSGPEPNSTVPLLASRVNLPGSTNNAYTRFGGRRYSKKNRNTKKAKKN